mgnify:CR=1 FL=1
MKKFNVGIQLYGVRNSMKEDFEGTLKALADMGYEYVEFAGYHGKSAEEIKAILDKLGLKCISAHQGLDFYNDDPDAAAEFLKTFGVKYSVIPWYKKEELAGTDAWNDTVKRFNAVGETLKKHGMKLSLYYSNPDWHYEYGYNPKSTHQWLAKNKDTPDTEKLRDYEVYVKAMFDTLE